MRKIGLGLAFLAFSAAAFAQGGMGGGMGGMGGGMGGQGGGMGGRHGGGMEGGPPPGGGRRPDMMKPIKRGKIDKPVEEMFRAADADHDNIVTLDELNGVLAARREAVIRARFDKIDANHDKVIDQREFVTWQAGLGSLAASEDQAMGAGNGPVPEYIPVPIGKDRDDVILLQLIEPLSPTVIATANTNYDRGISLDELLTYERKKFDAIDTDKDGELSMDELRALEPKGRGQGGPGGRGGMGPGGGRPDGPPPGGSPPGGGFQD